MSDFNLGCANFGHGSYCNHGRSNGFQAMVLESYQKTNKLIECFKDAVDQGYDPNTVIPQVFKQCNTKESDLTDFDIKRLNQEIDEYLLHKNM